jgi:lysophospholipase L1-like esterase
MLRAARERTDAPVILGGIPRFRAVPALAEPLRAVIDGYARPLRSAQRAAASTVGDGVSFVDIAVEASPRFLGRPESMSSDGFHPSPVGYGFWADALAPTVVEALG